MHACGLKSSIGPLPNGNPRVLMRALLQMTMATDDATESVRDPITPSWKPAVILPSCGMRRPCQLRTPNPLPEPAWEISTDKYQSKVYQLKNINNAKCILWPLVNATRSHNLLIQSRWFPAHAQYTEDLNLGWGGGQKELSAGMPEPAPVLSTSVSNRVPEK